MRDTLAIVRSYIRSGWSGRPRSTSAEGTGAQRLAHTAAERTDRTEVLRQWAGEYRHHSRGRASATGLADIDLDCPEALAVAAAVLPPTLRFGRPSTRAAHSIYGTSFAPNTKAVIAFDDPVKLRTDPKGCAAA